MKIVFLDASSLGKREFSVFNEFGEFISYNLTDKSQIAERIKEADIVITNKVYFGKEEFEAGKNLKVLLISATGYNNVDLKEAHKNNVIVANVKAYSTESVAQLTMTYILNLASSLINYNKDVKDGLWTKSPIFTMLNHNFVNLHGKKLALIGYGTIAKRVEELAKVFGMEVLISQSLFHKENNQENRVEFKEILKIADFISLHCPLSESTYKLFSTEEFQLMKESAFLINTARGPIVDEEALYEALKTKQIAGSAIDVMCSEPPREGSKLFELDNIIITPHVAWASNESIDLLLEGLVNNIKLYLEGNLKSL